jgi:hypothetical protein
VFSYFGVARAIQGWQLTWAWESARRRSYLTSTPSPASRSLRSGRPEAVSEIYPTLPRFSALKKNREYQEQAAIDDIVRAINDYGFCYKAPISTVPPSGPNADRREQKVITSIFKCESEFRKDGS